MSYLHYTEDDFFHDPKFRSWVIQPDPELNYFWEKWIINHPEKKNQVKIARRLVKTVQIKEFEWHETRKQNLWQKINKTLQQGKSDKINSNVIKINNQEAQKKKSVINAGWLKAAVISLLLSGCIYWVNQQFEFNPQPVLPVANIIEKSNPKGQKSKVFLPDGSVVILNSASKIEYQPDFNSEQRLVKLEGEAFFEVVKDTLRPFIVDAGEAKTTVLGTSFNIKAFSTQDKTQISLVEGQLKVTTLNDSNVILNKGESAIYNKSNKKIRQGTFDYLSDIAWKDGILYFDNTSLHNAFDRLENWYGIEFRYNQLPGHHIMVTGKFENEYLTNILKSLSYSVDFEYTIENGNEVHINFK